MENELAPQPTGEMKIASSGALLWKISGIFSEDKKKKKGKVRVMFSNRRQSAPELEDNLGRSHFQCFETTHGRSAGFGSGLREEGRVEEHPAGHGGVPALQTDQLWGRVLALGTRGAPSPCSNPGTCRRKAGGPWSGDEAQASPAALSPVFLISIIHILYLFQAE